MKNIVVVLQDLGQSHGTNGFHVTHRQNWNSTVYFELSNATKLWIIGSRKLVVEVDAQYIKGMLNKPDIHPNAAMNRWISAILMFDFELVHVPGAKHKGPDGLSRRRVAEDGGEEGGEGVERGGGLGR